MSIENAIQKDKFGTPLYTRDFKLENDFGLIPGYGSFINFGESLAIGNTPETIWNDHSIYQFPLAASQMTVSSTSLLDTSDGTGLRRVTINYLDENYIEQTEDVILNGQTPVLTVATNIFRINSFNASLDLSAQPVVGSLEFNQGTVYVGTGTVTGGVPLNKYNIMPPNRNNSKTGIYTVPANTDIAFRNNLVSSVGNQEAFFDFTARIAGIGPFLNVLSLAFKDAYINVGPDLPGFGILPAKTDARINAHSLSGGQDVTVILGSVFIRRTRTTF